MNANVYATKNYENKTALRPKKTNPIQTQSNPISKQLQGGLEFAWKFCLNDKYLLVCLI